MNKKFIPLRFCAFQCIPRIFRNESFDELRMSGATVLNCWVTYLTRISRPEPESKRKGQWIPASAGKTVSTPPIISNQLAYKRGSEKNLYPLHFRAFPAFSCYGR